MHRKKPTPVSGSEVRRLPGVTLTVNFRQASPTQSLQQSPPSSTALLSPPMILHHKQLAQPYVMFPASAGGALQQPPPPPPPVMLMHHQQQLPESSIIGSATTGSTDLPRRLEFTRVTADDPPPPLLSPNHPQATSPGYELDIRIIDISSEAFAKRIRNRTNTSSSSKSTSSSRHDHSSDSNHNHYSSSSRERATPSRQASSGSRHNTSPNHPYIVFKSSSSSSNHNNHHYPSVSEKARSEKKSSSKPLDPNNLSPVTHREVVKKVIRKDKLENAPLPGIACQICGTRKTGQWRRGPDGPRTLCNGCGLAFARLKKK